MLFRFPPNVAPVNDPTFLTAGESVFAKLKIESKAGKRTVFLTEHTLIFVISGIKLLHFAEQTLKVTPDCVFLLKKGIYVMAEYIEEGMNFEALMLFIPESILKSFLLNSQLRLVNKENVPCVVLAANSLIQDFKAQFRQYFDHQLFDYRHLIPLKQQEILTLLFSSGYKNEMTAFIQSAVSIDPLNMSAIVAENILQPITISELARLCNRSLATFKRDFKKHYDCSPRIYINRQRLMHARMLLQTTNKRISDIASSCAFESTSYFTRAFKREFGVTPQAIRAVIAME
ncbi:AraC-type DNA-binding protein [Mucilaginibacter gossypiicola]|uniref:AraC-type DNA-binding protein n=1 Tax=Mucilaginibacter gossypiicola TaxID=551995 RepID=A0A1H8CZS6_9SPHI|nr:AraC family transcriptional regulator [Mucilaginibacter gossypiicola]SEN00496.1 AraC-type DNA-binding protein [Mucilaginibacter gossypiicola]